MAISMRRPTSTGSWSDLRLLVGGLAVASAVELLILRTFTRTAIHIPALHSLQSPYEFLTEGGRFAYFVAVALMVPALVMLGSRFGRQGVAALFATLLFTVAAAAAAFGAADRLTLDGATLAAVAVLAFGFAARTPARSPALPIASFGLAFALSGSFSVAPEFAQVNLALDPPAWLLDGAEVFGLVFALSSPLLLGRTNDRVARWCGIAVGVAALVFFLGNGSTSRFLLLWNVGLSGVLPGFVYAAAGGALTFTLVGLLRRGRTLEAAGLMLLISGGIGLHSTYQSGLVVAGLAALWVAVVVASEGANGAVPESSNG